MAITQEIEQWDKEFRILVFRKFILLRNTVEKLLEESGELDDEDIEILLPIYEEFEDRKRKGE